jgi:hypothetical protein
MFHPERRVHPPYRTTHTTKNALHRCKCWGPPRIFIFVSPAVNQSPGIKCCCSHKGLLRQLTDHATSVSERNLSISHRDRGSSQLVPVKQTRESTAQATPKHETAFPELLSTFKRIFFSELKTSVIYFFSNRFVNLF